MFQALAIAFALMLAGCGTPDRQPGEPVPLGVFDPATFGPRDAPQLGPQPQPELLSYGPEGPDNGTWNVGQIQLTFTQPVVPLATAETTNELRVTTEGNTVAGRAYWHTVDQLVFETTAELGPARKYDVQWDGRGELAPFAWSFETTRPEITTVVGGEDQHLRRNAPLYLVTSLEPKFDELRERIRVDVNGKAWGIRASQPDPKSIEGRFSDADHVVQIDHDPFPLGARVEVGVAPGWRSLTGPLPARSAFRRELDVHPALTVGEIDCEGTKCTSQSIDIEVSTQLAEKQERRFRVRPEPPQLEIAVYGTSVWLSGRFVPGTDYTLTIDGALTDVYGQHLGKDRIATLRFAMPDEALYLTRSGGTVVDDGVAQLGISSRHVHRIVARVAKVPVERYRELLLRDDWRDANAPPLDELGPVVEATIEPALVMPTEWGSTPLDLAKIVGDYRGPVAVELRADTGTRGYESAVVDLRDRGLFLVGSLAPHVFDSTPQSWLRVEDLRSKRPAANVEIVAWQSNAPRVLGRTNDEGLLDLGPRPAADQTGILVARGTDGEFGLLPLARTPRLAATPWLEHGEAVQGELVAERGVYRPGDDLFVTGWSVIATPHHPWGQRELPSGVDARLELLDRDGLTLDSAIVGAPRGRFWTKLQIPKSAKLGGAQVRATLLKDGVEAHDHASTYFRIEEFRTPTFEVTATPSATDVVGDEDVTVEVASRYLSGTAAAITMGRARQRCWVTSAPAPDGWLLGVEPGWSGGIVGREPRVDVTGPGSARTVLTALASEEGETRRCDVSVTVQNPSFQEEGDTASVLAHPSNAYLGVFAPEEPLPIGRRVQVRLGLFDVEGRSVDASREVVDLTIKRIWDEENPSDGGYRYWVMAKPKEAVVATCPNMPVVGGTCAIPRVDYGDYVFEATSRQDVRRRLKQVVRAWATSEETPSIALDVPLEIQDPGKVTAVTVRTETPTGLAIVERHGISKAVAFRTKRGRARIELDPELAWAPEMHVSAYAIDYAPDVPTLAAAHGSIRFDDRARRLDVSVAAPDTGVVREEIKLDVTAKAGQQPVDGVASVWVVDDAILALTGYALPDLVRAFYPAYVADVDIADALSDILPRFVREPHDHFGGGMGVGGLSGSGFGAGGGGLGTKGGADPRVDFRATPFFVGDAVVKGGRAELKFNLPDSMTRFRVFAVVSADLPGSGAPVRFGTADDTIAVGAPLVLRPTLPRFVRPGDAPEIAAVVQNTTGHAGKLEVEFALEGESVTWVTGVSPRTSLAIGAGEEKRVGFDARVVSPGMTAVTMRARFTPDDGSTPAEDAAQLVIASEPERTSIETVATYGTLDDDQGVSIPIKAPASVRPDVGGIEVTLTSTILGGLRDATRELIHYPYGCAEQTASRMLPLVALSDLDGFVDATELPDGQTISAFVDAGLARLLSMQHASGGFGYWPGAAEPNPYVSAYVTWLLHLAQTAGHDVDKRAFASALDYLETAVAPQNDLPEAARWFGDVRRAIAVHVLADAGRAPIRAIDELIDRRRDLPMFARAFVSAALAEVAPEDPRLGELERELTNAITQTPSSAAVVESLRWDLGPYFHSDARSSAIVLMALARLNPDSPVVVKLARGLMEMRYGGAWRNTQENAYALVALADYARHYEATEPNFEATVWIENAMLVQDRWTGRSSKTRTGRVPMQELLTVASRGPAMIPVNLRRRGEGRAYYRLAMTYAPSGPELPAIARGLDVRREFRRQGAEPTSSPPRELTAGEVFAVDVTVHNKALTRYVAIDIPVPAGVEPIDLSLGSAKTLPMGGSYGWFVSHREYHDDRIILFADQLHPGTHTHTVYLRATTPGAYAFPPTRAEAMYTPEVFGRTIGTTVEIR